MQKIFSIILALIQSILLLFGANGGNESAWQLDGVPAYDGGIVCKTVYNAGSGLKWDYDGPTETDSKMQLVTATDLGEYEAYCSKLEENGFVKTYSNVFGGVNCNAFRKDGKLYYTYLSEILGEVRIIEDNGTNSFEDFGYTYSAGSAATVYQFDHVYSGLVSDRELYSTNGMMYIIRLADNSLIVIDGGSIRQSSDKNIDECIKFMHKITGTEAGETIKIALWYGTHGHSDHITFFYKLLGYYHKEIDLERAMFNYPSFSLIEHDKRADMFRERLVKYYPNVKYLAPHTGMSFSIANVDFDVIYTHEDAVSAFTGKTPVTNANDGSTVCRLTAAGKRLLILGDLNILGEHKIVNMHGKDIFKTDILQAPHHLYNADTVIYGSSKAEWVLCPNSENMAVSGMPGYTSARLFYRDDQLLYADNALYGIEMSADGLTVSVDYTECVPCDGSSMNGER